MKSARSFPKAISIAWCSSGIRSPPNPTIPDVRALLRIAVVWNIPVVSNMASADFLFSSPFMQGEYRRQVPDYEDRKREGLAAEGVNDRCFAPECRQSTFNTFIQGRFERGVAKRLGASWRPSGASGIAGGSGGHFKPSYRRARERDGPVSAWFDLSFCASVAIFGRRPATALSWPDGSAGASAARCRAWPFAGWPPGFPTGTRIDIYMAANGILLTVRSVLVFVGCAACMSAAAGHVGRFVRLDLAVAFRSAP